MRITFEDLWAGFRKVEQRAIHMFKSDLAHVSFHICVVPFHCLSSGMGNCAKLLIYLRNALIPIITVMAMDMPQLIGGSAFVELVFNWPGMGKELFTSVMIREYNMMMAIVIVTAMVVVIANWVADILYALVDPRIRVVTRSK
jgi:hypothetical protein